METWIPDQSTREFYKDYVGISDPQELKDHLETIQQQLLQHGPPYKCIERYKFAYSRMCRRFFYDQLLEIGRNTKDPWLIDIGCCAGIDLRQLQLDGYPGKYLVGTDISQYYIDYGYALCKDRGRFPAQFEVGDLFDDRFLSCQTTASPAVSRQGLNRFVHQAIAVISGSVLHLFDSLDTVQQFIIRVKALLRPGGLFAGAHVASNQSMAIWRANRGSTKQYTGIDDFRRMLEKEQFTDIVMQTEERMLENDDDFGSTLVFWLSFTAIYNPT
ncbi:uncharacterized protein BYT42DRAFT_609904 [Radiomyces spectabilis]|uniref:uncharacterized protein n=1 Tax=Radiomyces spectabilis TaxID=64574 RepID=UPI0022210EA5|nr:uncharacterized protein BYT42DRAFT_609904 [Radiomyces spectabilis]KAI8394167.1 hypothetical protein BYT42DRAFT_609904 [Radiomyces spectabilis]